MSGANLPLRDIRLPPEPGWWPPAPGWWLLGLFGVLLLALIGRWLWTAARRRRARRARLALFDHLVGDAGAEPAARVRAANEALRRVVLAGSPGALQLSGADWLAWLDRGLGDAPFSSEAGRLLLEAPYRPTLQSEQAECLINLLRRRVAEGCGD